MLYLTDGEAQFAHTAATVEFLARNGRMPEMIVVAIGNTDRTRDLTPTKATLTRPDGSPMEFPTAGGADRFLTFIATELKPFVEKKYRTAPFSVFAGHSFGGLFAMHAFTARPETFNAYIAVSPTLTWDSDMPVRRTAELLRDRRELRKTLVVTMGDEPVFDAALATLRKTLSGSTSAGFEWDIQRIRRRGSRVGRPSQPLRRPPQGVRPVAAAVRRDGDVRGLVRGLREALRRAERSHGIRRHAARGHREQHRLRRPAAGPGRGSAAVLRAQRPQLSGFGERPRQPRRRAGGGGEARKRRASVTPRRSSAARRARIRCSTPSSSTSPRSPRS